MRFAPSGYFNMIAFPCGNTGVQMTGWFKKETKAVKDFNGLKMCIPGLVGYRR